MSDHAPDHSDHHEQLRQMMEAFAPVLEQYAAILDAYEGLVAQTRQRGWSDAQARELVFRALTGGGA